jgi:hypothetical protein
MDDPARDAGVEQFKLFRNHERQFAPSDSHLHSLRRLTPTHIFSDNALISTTGFRLYPQVRQGVADGVDDLREPGV